MPKAQSLKNIIEFWRRIVKRKKGVLTSRMALRVIAERVKISLQSTRTLTIAQAGAKLTMAYQAYFKARPEFPKWREEFQVGLIEVVANDTGKTAQQVKDRMKREKHQRIMGNNSKCIRQKNVRDLILRATATNELGELLNV